MEKQLITGVQESMLIMSPSCMKDWSEDHTEQEVSAQHFQQASIPIVNFVHLLYIVESANH